MKKIIISLLIIISLVGCSKTEQQPSYEAIQNYWLETQTERFNVEITCDLSQSVATYQLEYEYNANDSDLFTIIYPEILSGINGKISGDIPTDFTLQYGDTELDTPSIYKDGLSPAEAIPYIIYEIKNDIPTEIWTETDQTEVFDVLKYQSENEQDGVMRQIWFKDNKIIRAEVFSENNKILTLTFVD